MLVVNIRAILTYLYHISVLGDPRTNQNPALLTLSILFFRYHNFVASQIQRSNPDWSDEDVFQRARRTVVATLQVLIEFYPDE